jgi:hypothetical protein
VLPANSVLPLRLLRACDRERDQHNLGHGNEAQRRVQLMARTPCRSFVPEELVHGCCTHKRLPALPSQVADTKRSFLV